VDGDLRSSHTFEENAFINNNGTSKKKFKPHTFNFDDFLKF
jgi:hypothetical protein